MVSRSAGAARPPAMLRPHAQRVALPARGRGAGPQHQAPAQYALPSCAAQGVESPEPPSDRPLNRAAPAGPVADDLDELRPDVPDDGHSLRAWL